MLEFRVWPSFGVFVCVDHSTIRSLIRLENKRLLSYVTGPLWRLHSPVDLPELVCACGCVRLFRTCTHKCYIRADRHFLQEYYSLDSNYVCVCARLLHLFNRLKGELEEKHERWLSCQRRCDTAREQLSSWQQRGEQMNRKCCAAEEEVTRLREALEKVQQETRQLRTERSRLWYLFCPVYIYFLLQSELLTTRFCSLLFYYYIFTSILFIWFWFFSLPEKWRNKFWTSWWLLAAVTGWYTDPSFLNQLLTMCDRVIHEHNAKMPKVLVISLERYLLFLCSSRWFESETEDSWWVVWLLPVTADQITPTQFWWSTSALSFFPLNINVEFCLFIQDFFFFIKKEGIVQHFGKRLLLLTLVCKTVTKETDTKYETAAIQPQTGLSEFTVIKKNIELTLVYWSYSKLVRNPSHFGKILNRNVKIGCFGLTSWPIKSYWEPVSLRGCALLFLTLTPQPQTGGCLNPWLGNRPFCL